MGIERRLDVSPKYPRTTGDVLNVAGILNNRRNRNKLERLIYLTSDPTLTDSEGRVTVSPANFASLVTLANRLKEENLSSRRDLESAFLPDGNRITARRIFGIQQITEIVTRARENQQPFSLEQIIQVFDPAPKRSDKSKADAREKAKHKIENYRRKIKPHGWTIDLVTRKEDKEGWKNPQFWFRQKNEPPFTPLPGTQALAKN